MTTRSCDVRDKVVLITGATRGLGRAIAFGLAEAGARVIVNSRKPDACDATAAEIRERGGDATALSAHCGDTDALDGLIERGIASCGRVDVLFNNAGINPRFATLPETSVALFDKLIDVNLKGPWYLASRLAGHMRDNGGGSIVNVISVGGLRPGPGVGVYCAAKAALHGLTRSMAAEWAAWGIRVNSLAPGAYNTDMLRGAADSDPGFLQTAADASLMKRIAEPEELVGSALYLASDASSYTTGQVLVSDGGMMAAA